VFMKTFVTQFTHNPLNWIATINRDPN
jgi:hypothetical protein